MKKIIILLIAIVSLPAFVGCELEEDAQFNYVTFGEQVLGLDVQEFESNSIEVTVYTANVAGSDRTFNISVDESSTLNAEAYNIPATVTIPANSNKATFTIEVSDNNLPPAGGTLVLEIEGEEGLLTGDPLELVVSKICEFDPAGMYVNNSGFFGEEFPVEVIAGDEPNEYIIEDLYAEGTDITFIVNEDYSITVPFQDAWVSGDYGQASIEGTDDARVSPCTGEIFLAVEHTVEAGSFGVITEELTKSADAGAGEETEEEGEEETTE